MKKTYVIDCSSPTKQAESTLEMHISTMIDMRETTPNREELEWEIRLYEFMLLDPKDRLEEYMTARFKGAQIVPKREVVKRLGWIVP